jgi:hypothetical protein
MGFYEQFRDSVKRTLERFPKVSDYLVSILPDDYVNHSEGYKEIEGNLVRRDDLVSKLEKKLSRKEESSYKLHSQVVDLVGKVKDYEDTIDETLRVRESEMVQQYRSYMKEVDEAYGLMNGIRREELEDLKKQLGYTRGAIGYKDKLISELKVGSISSKEVLMPLFEFAEARFKSEDVNAILLDDDYYPVYATPKFYDVFSLSKGEVLTASVQRLLAYEGERPITKIIDYAKGGLKKSKLEFELDGEMHKMELSHEPLIDKSGKDIGMFIQFINLDQKLIGRMKENRNKKKGLKIFEKILGDYSDMLDQIGPQVGKPTIEKA